MPRKKQRSPKESVSHSSKRKPSKIESDSAAVLYQARDGTTFSLPAPKHIWVSEFVVPPSSRKYDQHILDAVKRLYSNPDFRRDIEELKKEYPPSYWEREARLRKDAAALQEQLWKAFAQVPWQLHSVSVMCPSVCLQFEKDAPYLAKKWGLYELTSSVRWIEFLVRNWDPTTQSQPPTPPWEARPGVYPWIVELNFCQDSKGSKEFQQASVILKPGVSFNEAKQAIREAMKAMPESVKRKPSRPPLSDLERGLLRMRFQEFCATGKGTASRMIQGLQGSMQALGKPLSRTTIWNEWHRYQAQHAGQPKLPSK